VPEAAVNEHSQSRSREDDIRADSPAGSGDSEIHSEPAAMLMQKRTKSHLRTRAASPVCRHSSSDSRTISCIASPVVHTFSIEELAPTREQLDQIGKALTGYLRLPFAGTLPGAFVEAVVARVRNATILATYDFVDVVDRDRGIGWQVKSTKASTPVTWKRAKLPNAPSVIAASHESLEGLQALGDAIIAFCNNHVEESLREYGLSGIGYARAILSESVDQISVQYFERELVTAEQPRLFDPAAFEWRWSQPKNVVKKEQLQALHGFHRSTGKKWFAWHGLGENQLHFSGESSWWPRGSSEHSVSIDLPRDTQKITFDEFVAWVTQLEEEVEDGS